MLQLPHLKAVIQVDSKVIQGLHITGWGGRGGVMTYPSTPPRDIHMKILDTYLIIPALASHHSLKINIIFSYKVGTLEHLEEG